MEKVLSGEGHRLAGDRETSASRRRLIDPTTCERDYSLEELDFMRALDEYKRTNSRMFPTCSEILVSESSTAFGSGAQRSGGAPLPQPLPTPLPDWAGL